MPGAPVWIGHRVGAFRQCLVYLPPVSVWRRPVGCRADQRVPEPHPGADLGQARRGRRRNGVAGTRLG